MTPATSLENRIRIGPRPQAYPLAFLALGLAFGLLPAHVRGAGDPPADQASSGAAAADEEGAGKPESGDRAKPRGTPPQKPKTAVRPPARPGATQAPPLRFTDEDLERFHKKPPEATGDGDEEAPVEEGDGGPPASGPGAPGAVPAAPPAKRPAAARPAPQATPPPGVDPLLPFRERERRQAMRADQLKSLRTRIASLQARLDYLKARRLAIVNPLYPMPRGGSAEQERQDAALKPRQLLDLVEKEIRVVEDELAEAQEDLIDFQTRFASELGAP